MPTKKRDEMLTTREVAEQIRFSYLKVLNHINAGDFPNAINKGTTGVGKRYLIPQSDVDNFIASRRVGAL